MVLEKKRAFSFFLVFMAVFSFTDTVIGNDSQYTDAQRRLDDRVAKENQAYQYEKSQRFEEAINIFTQIANEYGDSAVASPARNALTRLYEKTGQYDKALEQLEWFLKGSQNEQGRQASLADKKRLLEKIEAQKRRETIEEQKPPMDNQAKPIQRMSDFYKADYGSQKKFLEKELPEDTEIRRLGKHAMLAEHAGKFGDAKSYYEQMLQRKEEAVAAFGESGWVMLYPAVQRMSELTGDEAREKEILVWIRDNVLVEQGPYHQYLSGLLPQVQEHLKGRIKKFGL